MIRIIVLVFGFILFTPVVFYSQDGSKTLKWNVNDLPLYQKDLRPIELRNTWGDTMQATAGTLVVPEVRSLSNTNHIQVSFGILKAYHSTILAPIVILAGGPGGSGIDMGKGSYFYLFKELRNYTDVILLDQRGTGRSIPNIACKNTLNLPLAIRDNAEEILTTKITESASECLSVFTNKGVNLDGYNSWENAGDIEDLRKALGYEKVSLYGYSYGTQLAHVYIKLFPERVEKVIMAGPVAPDQALKLPSGIHAEFRGIDSLAKLDKRLSKFIPDYLSLMSSVHERLKKDPYTITVPERVRHEVPFEAITMTDFHLQLITQSEVGDDRWIRNFPSFYYKISKGQWNEAGRELFDLSRQTMVHGLLITTNCATSYTEERHQRGLEEEKTTVLSHASTSFGRLKDRCIALGCKLRDEDFLAPIGGQMPLLLIGGSLDGRTPLVNLYEIASRFPNHQKVIVKNAGHGNLMDNQIKDKVIDFITGKNTGDLVIERKVDFNAPVPYKYSLGDTLYNVAKRENTEQAMKLYKELKNKFWHSDEYIFEFNENILNSLGYKLIGENKITDAEKIFKLNTEEYPDAWNVFDSYGEVLIKKGDINNGIKMYQKSIKLNFMNGNGHMAIKKLK